VATGWNAYGQCNVRDWREVVAIAAGCAHTVGVVEPAGETHENAFGTTGTSVLILQPLPSGRHLVGPCGDFLRAPVRVCHATTKILARRIQRELAEPDGVTPLALDAAALELIAIGARSAAERVEPRWLRRLLDYMHAEFLRTPTIRN